MPEILESSIARKINPPFGEVTNVSVEEVYGDNSGVLGLKVKCNKTGEIRDLPTPGVFVFVGRNVLNAPLKQADGSFLCDVIESGEVVVDLKMRTTTKGLWAAGDIRIDAAKQVVCAAADGEAPRGRRRGRQWPQRERSAGADAAWSL